MAPRALLGAVCTLLLLAPSVLDCSSSSLTIDGPYLTTLGLAPQSGGDVSLVPSFSPVIHDYYVLCAAGANTFSVSLAAPTGMLGKLERPTPSRASSMQTVDVTVSPNQAIVAIAKKGTATTEYWVRCLPPDFPTVQVVPNPDAGTAPPGYYLLGNQTPAFGGVGYAMVLDQNGVPVWYEAQPQTGEFNSTTGAFDVASLATGSISLISWPSTLATAPFEVHHLPSGTTTPVAAMGFALDPHELRALPNGDFLLFTDQIQTGVDLTGYDVPMQGGQIERFGPNSSILPCDVLEVDARGNLVWKWVATDHLDPVKDNTLPGLEAGPDQTLFPDPFHCNSIDVDPATGNLLVSARHMDSIFYIERPSGKILWKMGGSTYTKDGAAYVPVQDAFHRQHDARLQPGWSTDCGGHGQISVFDDESYETVPARAVVYDVDVGEMAGSDDCEPAGATVAWQFAGATSSNLMGSFRISSDGSRVIGWGVATESTPVLTEVDEAGDDLLDCYFTQPTTSYRAVKVPIDAFNLSDLRNAAGLH
jgi:hypothetical protein